MSNTRSFKKQLKSYFYSKFHDPSFWVGFAVFAAMLTFVLAIYQIENGLNKGITSLFDSFWYTYVTLTTTGYGDITPVTFWGRIVGIFTMALGVVFTALVAGNITSALIGVQQKKGKGLLKLRNMKNHFIICGWKPDFERIIDGVLEANVKLLKTDIVLINTAPSEVMEAFMSNPKYKLLNYVYGDFIEEDVLLRASIKTASKVLLLADYSQPRTAMEIDSRTILAILTIENLNRYLYTAAELLDEKFENHLKLAHCDEVILSQEYERKLLINASTGIGVSHVIRDLMDAGNQTGLSIQEIPSDFLGKTFDSLFKHYYETQDVILIGLLENTGNLFTRKREALNEAQKTPNITQIVANLKKIKVMQSNASVLAPEKDYLIRIHSKAITVSRNKEILNG